MSLYSALVHCTVNKRLNELLFHQITWNFVTAHDLVCFARVFLQEKGRGTSTIIFLGTVANAICGDLFDSVGHVLSVVDGDYPRKCPLVSNVATFPSGF
jgi:hypothetical protein